MYLMHDRGYLATCDTYVLDGYCDITANYFCNNIWADCN